MTARRPARRPSRARPAPPPARGEGARATYLYAVVHKARGAPAATGAPAGLPGTGRARFLSLGGGLWLAAADAPLDRDGAGPVERRLRDLAGVSECALAHQRMVDHLARVGTVVPMKLFTLFTSDDKAVAAMGTERRRLAALVRRLAGREEWGVRVSQDEQEVRTAARRQAVVAARGLGAGARFLTLKSAEKTEASRLADEGRREAERGYTALSRPAVESRRRAIGPGEPGLRLLLDAVFLVPRTRAARLRQAAAREARRLAGRGFRVVLTGPWPAYSFVANT